MPPSNLVEKAFRRLEENIKPKSILKQKFSFASSGEHTTNFLSNSHRFREWFKKRSNVPPAVNELNKIYLYLLHQRLISSCCFLVVVVYCVIMIYTVQRRMVCL